MSKLDAVCKTVAESLTPAVAEGALLVARSRLRWAELGVDGKSDVLAPLNPLLDHLVAHPDGRLWRLLAKRAAKVAR